MELQIHGQQSLQYLSDYQNNTITIFSNSNQNQSSFYINSGIVYFQFVTSSHNDVPLYFYFSINAQLQNANLNSVVCDGQQFVDQVTYIESIFVESSCFNNLTTVPPFTLYDLSTIERSIDLFSFYTNASSYDVLSPEMSNGIPTYSANASSLYIQYVKLQNSDGIARVLVGPSKMFTSLS
uniref:CUB_2 domain-containing protein n=1 Tax=Panagrellus redivivus TaxID=6233 RepID=A0A7E4W0U9_PANRE